MKLIAKMLFVVILLGMVFIQEPTAATEQIRVYVNESELIFPDAKPFQDISGRTLVPARAIAGALGCDVDWDIGTWTVVLTRGRVSAELPIGKNEVSVLGVKKPTNTAAIIQDRQAFVPVRFVAEAFGAVVVWEADTKTVRITDEGNEIYRLGEVVWDIEETDTLGNNSDGFLTLTKESGLVLDERRVGDDQRKVIVIKISVDTPGQDIEKQREEADALLRQYIGGELVDEIMDYAATKEDGDTVIERKYYETEGYKIYITGYIGPTVLYLYV